MTGFGGTLFEDHRHPDQAHRHDLAEVAFPRGFISLWYGVAAAVPSGWAICDGTNGTPDMRGRVAVGVDTGQIEFDVLGEAGGAKTHTLTTAEMPSHTHPLQGGGYNPIGTGTVGFANSPANTVSLAQTVTAGTGGGSAHNNLPPYRTLHYVMRLA